MSRNGTSLREQSLFHFIHKFFPDIINRFVIPNGKKALEVDLFIPSLNLVIEYDGSYWHKNKIAIDNKKNKVINELGYSILRIREPGLPPLEEFKGYLIDLPYESEDSWDYDFINYALDYLSHLVQEPLRTQIRANHIDEEEFKQESKYIYALRYPDTIEPNISTMCGIEYWDTKKNYPLVPTHVQKYDWVPAVLVCKNNREIPLPRYRRNYKNECRTKCNMCFCGIMCPLIPWCKKSDSNLIHCEYVENRFWEMIRQKKQITRIEIITKYQYYLAFTRWLKEESDIGERMFDVYRRLPIGSIEKENLSVFLRLLADIPLRH